MRKIILTIALALVVLSVNSQEYNKKMFTLGVGYLGETITHPGFVLQAELQHPISKRWSIPTGIETGYYLHNYHQQAALLQLVSGIRFHATPKFYMGAKVGAGGMLSWHHSDKGVYEVDNEGNVSKVSSFAGLDLLLSSGLEFGYKLSKKKEHFIWLRPKYMWQKNVNEKALGHIALEIGYSFSI